MQMNKIELGKLEKIDLRNVWTNESEGFTPWLAKAENLRLLGDTIGLELELEAQEKNIGPFRADILCKDTATDHWVLIENQLEKTDHVHLGQLLTYASGLKAVNIVWVARKFTEEHRAALDWLNEITDDQFNFFGLEVELWRIGESPIAPKFNIVSKPNDWSKTVNVGAKEVSNTALTDSKVLQRDFWTAFVDFVKEKNPTIKTTKPYPQNWMYIPIGRSGIRLAAVASLWDSEAGTFSTNELRTELVLDDNNSKNYFKQLEAEKEQIEKEVGEPLTWHNPPERRVCRIYVRKPTNLQDRGKWPEQQAWLLDKLELFRNVFAERAKTL